VHFKVFQEVEWSLLPPGHTHEDIDAWFSIIARWMVKVYIIVLSEFCKRLPTAFSQSTIACQLVWCSNLFDVWALATDERRGDLRHFNKAHAFRVKENTNGRLALVACTTLSCAAHTHMLAR
jgi:hypothetical protein